MCLSAIPQHNTINDIHMNNIHSTVQRGMHVFVHKMDCDDYNNYKCYIYVQFYILVMQVLQHIGFYIQKIN